MSSVDNVKVVTTYFPTQPKDIRMNRDGTETMPLRTIKFQKYLQKSDINIPTNGEEIGLLGTVLADAD